MDGTDMIFTHMGNIMAEAKKSRYNYFHIYIPNDLL